MDEYIYTGNDLKAANKVYKKFKLPCALAQKYTVTKDHVMMIHNTRINHEYPIAIPDGVLHDLKAKQDYIVKFNPNSVEIDNFTIPGINMDPEQFEWNRKTWENISKIFTRRCVTVDVAPVLTVCKAAKRDEAISFAIEDNHLYVDTIETDFEAVVPIKYGVDYEDHVMLPSSHLKAWLSLAKANSTMTMQFMSDYPAIIEIQIYDTFWDGMIAPRVENDW